MKGLILDHRRGRKLHVSIRWGTRKSPDPFDKIGKDFSLT